MCGIFGIIGQSDSIKKITHLVKNAEIRGKDSSGAVIVRDSNCVIYKAEATATKLFRSIPYQKARLILGHSRLITNDFSENQPVHRDNVITLHNGIVVNHDALWAKHNLIRNTQLDSEIIPALFAKFFKKSGNGGTAAEEVLKECEGIVSAVIYVPTIGKIFLISNNGSLYTGKSAGLTIFSSEEWPLKSAGCSQIVNVKGVYILEAPKIDSEINEKTVISKTRLDLVPKYSKASTQAKKLNYTLPDLKRCTKCILPETMPFIIFDENGVCNYCTNYVTRNKPKPIQLLKQALSDYKRETGPECIIPFSGGRDSCFALHLARETLGMRPITYTYDWGMVTDLGRRNISRMCGKLGVENIIVAADIEKKRKNIQMNLNAWLKTPHLGMLNILMAGDKHFFRFVEDVKRRTNVDLNLWGVNPLETTHFKAGFLGIPPKFINKSVYNSGWLSQLHYQKCRLVQMSRNTAYINSSIFDTLSGEYWRSLHKKSDYYHLFDYYEWNEIEIDETLAAYDWERAVDTETTWRIGDGTAAFYNYVYHRLAGLSEHDTFRSNQIREGQMTREEALRKTQTENKPRYENIKWYLDAVGVDFDSCIDRINSTPTQY